MQPAPTLVESAAPVSNGAGADKNKRVNPIKLKKMQDRCAELERTIATLEQSIADADAELANFRSTDETLRVTELAEKYRKDLSAAMSEWEELTLAVEASA